MKTVTKLKKYTVHFMTPYCTWEGVHARSKKEAIDKCPIPSEYDMNEPGMFSAIEEVDIGEF